MSHFWDGEFLPASPYADAVLEHEERSCQLFERLLAANRIDATPWGLSQDDLRFVQALILGRPDESLASHPAMRLGARGVVGSDKRFLYDIVANHRSGFDVDKLDYFERDCHYAGVVKVAFDRARLMGQARVALADGELQICWPRKCLYEVLNVFQTRFALHTELYQHRVCAAVSLMLRDALLHADADTRLRVSTSSGARLRLSQCGTSHDDELDGFLQLTDGLLPLVRMAAANAEAAAEKGMEAGAEEGVEAGAEENGLRGAEEGGLRGAKEGGLRGAKELLERLDRRQLYRFVGSVVLEAAETTPSVETVIAELVDLAEAASSSLRAGTLRADVRRVHFGCGTQNPLDRIRFFDSKDGRLAEGGVPHASRQPTAAYAARLPGAFEERSLRVWVTDDALLPVAKDVFAAWCSRRALCNDECQLERVREEDEVERALDTFADLENESEY